MEGGTSISKLHHRKWEGKICCEGISLLPTLLEISRQGKYTVIYFTYVGDTINAYIITVTQFLWSIPLCRWFEFIFHMLWDRGNCICKQNTLSCFKSCFLIFLCLVLSVIWPYSTIHTEFSHHLYLRL